jgi:Ca-activated chloride channel homolog
MTITHPFFLLLALLPLAWVLYERRNSARRGALILKAAAILCVIGALSQPRLTVFETKVALAILADTSASVSPSDLAAESDLATKIEKGRGRNVTVVLPFARSTRAPARGEAGKAWHFQYSSREIGHATNLETALREAVGSLPAGLVPRVLLVSDGNENQGSVTRAIWQAQQLGVPVDAIPLAGRPKPDLELESVSIPAQVFSGERFPVDLTLRSPRAAKAAVEISAEGKSLGSSPVDLAPGLNHFRAHANLTATGAIDLAGTISAPGLGQARFESAVTLRRPRVLLLSKDPAGTEAHLIGAMQANQFDLEQVTAIPEKLEPYQLIVINDWTMETIPQDRQQALENFVQQGGGLIWIAGERNVFVEKKEETPLERALPARLAPPRTPEGTAVVLIVDKSSSMEGKKMELAKLAAIGVVDNLRPIDSVGVLIFDNSFQWAVPIRRAEDRNMIKRLISGITPDGGTQIAPALTEAYRKINPLRSAYKHIVLLTDGISEEGDSMSLSREAMANKVTISTVGLGQDVNRAFLEKVAATAAGRSYFLNDPSGLEQILLRDVQEHTGTTSVEKTTHAVVAKPAEILDGVGMETAPALKGYVRFISKPTADTILSADVHDPLLVRWQYGLGRASVFTSDAKSRWAANWITWPGFDRLWSNIFRDMLPHAQSSEATAEYDRANNELVVDYRLARDVPEPPTIPDIFAFGPDGLQAPVQISKVAAGHYHGRIAIGQRQGLFRVRPLGESRAFPEVGLYRQEDEMIESGSNEQLLRQVAAATGGRFNPALKSLFDPAGRSVTTTLELWPGLLALAILLNIAELIMRKWRGLLETLHPVAQSVGQAEF